MIVYMKNNKNKEEKTIKTGDIELTNRLKEVMAAKNLSGYRLAKDLRIPNQWVYNEIMRSDHNPALKTALLISDYLGVKVDDIWSLKK